MRLRKLLAVLFCLGLCVSAAAGEGETFKLGAFLQLTGNGSLFGVEARNVINLAVEEINAKGGFNGKQIETFIYDTQGVADEAVKIAAKLIDVNKVDAVIGSVNSNEVLAASKYLDDAGIPTFGLGLSPSWMAEKRKNIFRACMNNNLSVPLSIGMVKKLGMTRLGIFKGQDDAALATAKEVARYAESQGIKIVADESYDSGDTDFSAQVANLIDAEPHTIFILSMGETGPILMKQLRQFGYNHILVYKESVMVAQIELAGKDACNFIIFANPYVTYNSIEECDIPIIKDYLTKYKNKYGDHSKTDPAYRAWDSMMVLWEATKIAGSNDRAAISAAMRKVKMPGLGGTLDFTQGNEGYGSSFNTFAFIDLKNILFDKWLAEGGYESYKQRTGNKY